MEDKFRYTFENDIFGDISTYVLTIDEIKQGALQEILNSGMKENGYILIDICRER